METQKYSTVSTLIKIEHIETGRLIGRGGCNLKPIQKSTGTLIYVRSKQDDTVNTDPIRIEIIDKEGDDSSNERIGEARCKLLKLVEKLKNEKKKVRFSDNDIYQNATPSNQRDFDSRERNNFTASNQKDFDSRERNNFTASNQRDFDSRERGNNFTPNNQRDFDSRERENNFTPSNQRDFDSRERGNNFRQETSYTTNARQPRNRRAN